MSVCAVARIPAENSLPLLISGAGERAEWRFLEFFTVNIRNKNTRAAYGQAAGAFLHWCESRGIRRIEEVQPLHVAGTSSSCRPCARLRPSSSTSPASACFSTGW
jgi:hypothetical protein